ncbi:unnamed protein product [Arctogadus glacialis]
MPAPEPHRSQTEIQQPLQEIAASEDPPPTNDGDLEDDVDAADTSTQTPTTADPSYQSHRVKSMERGGFTSRVRSVVVMVKQRELHGRLEEVIQLPGRQPPVKESMFVKGLALFHMKFCH